MVRFIQQLQSKAPEVQKESRPDEGYSTNEESDLFMLCYLFLCLALTMLLSLFRAPDTNTVPKYVTIQSSRYAEKTSGITT